MPIPRIGFVRSHSMPAITSDPHTITATGVVAGSKKVNYLRNDQLDLVRKRKDEGG